MVRERTGQCLEAAVHGPIKLSHSYFLFGFPDVLVYTSVNRILRQEAAVALKAMSRNHTTSTGIYTK